MCPPAIIFFLALGKRAFMYLLNFHIITLVLILSSEGLPSLPTQHLISIFSYFIPENLY